MQNIFYDVIIIGAGASGLMCAATAGYRDKRVLVIDHAPKAAAKIRISGGGKCNFTNLTVKPENFICQNPHFVKSALSRYPSSAFIDLVDRHGLEYEVRDRGKLFCLNRASDLIQILRTECDWAGVSFELNCTIKAVSYRPDQGYYLETDSMMLQCEKLVVATGALSFPKLKATDFGYRIAEQFGLNVVKQSPGLVPLVFKDKWQQRLTTLTGLSMDVKVSYRDQHFEEAILFTHQGLSGPAILQISNYWRQGDAITLNLLPGVNVLEHLKTLKKNNESVVKWLNLFWTRRFTQSWLEWFPLDAPLANVSDETLQAYAHQIENWTLYPSGTAGYGKAEVTLGGVDTDGVSSKTLEAKAQPGLYFIGEVLDVTGHLGGYNFQWAWASAVACGANL